MTVGEFTGMGFAPGVVRGTRSFRVDQFGRLTGVTHKQVWTPGENGAKCRKDDDTWAGAYGGIYRALIGTTPVSSTPSTPKLSKYSLTQSIPFARFTTVHEQKPEADAEDPKPLQHSFAACQCGFYGYFDGSDDYHDEKRVSAVVEAYGETVIGTRGFRAMKARIVALTVREGLDDLTASQVRKISTNYRGTAIFDSFDDMVREFAPDQSLEPSPENDPDFWTREAI